MFQAVTPNFYARAGEPTVPLVMVGVQFWTTEVPAWPLLQALADGRGMAASVHLVDTVDEVFAALGRACP